MGELFIFYIRKLNVKTLSHESRGGRRFVAPIGCEHTLGLVVTSQTMDTALDQNQTELGILVLAISLEVLANSDGLLDQVVQIFGQGWGKSLLLQDAKNLVAGHPTDLGDTVPITQHDTDLRRTQTLLGQLANLLDNIVGSQFKPLK